MESQHVNKKPKLDNGTATAANASGNGSEEAKWERHWQLAGPGEQIRNALDNGLATDVHFLVGTDDSKELIGAHSLLLALCSPVFQAQFRFNAHSDPGRGLTPERPIEVADVRPDAFRVMLAFIYACGKKDADIGLTRQNALDVHLAAKKYLVRGLGETCVEFLKTNLDRATAVPVLLYAREHDEQELIEAIDVNAKALLESEQFVDLDADTLESLFKRDSFRAGELWIYNAALRWSRAACTRRGEEPTEENMRAALGTALYAIRFPVMGTELFTEHVVEAHNLLSPIETVGVYAHLLNRRRQGEKMQHTKVPLLCSSKPRERTRSRPHRYVRQSHYCGVCDNCGYNYCAGRGEWVECQCLDKRGNVSALTFNFGT